MGFSPQWHFILMYWVHGAQSPGWHGLLHGWLQPGGRGFWQSSSQGLQL